jgi:hypothetical protein
MGKVIFGIIFLISIAGNIYILYSVYNGESSLVLRQIGLVGFAISNLIILIFGVTYYFAYRIQKNKKIIPDR